METCGKPHLCTLTYNPGLEDRLYFASWLSNSQDIMILCYVQNYHQLLEIFPLRASTVGEWPSHLTGMLFSIYNFAIPMSKCRNLLQIPDSFVMDVICPYFLFLIPKQNILDVFLLVEPWLKSRRSAALVQAMLVAPHAVSLPICALRSG